MLTAALLAVAIAHGPTATRVTLLPSGWCVSTNIDGIPTCVASDWSDYGSSLYAETILWVRQQEQPHNPPPTPIGECRQNAIEACGVGKVCWVLVSGHNGGVCAYACQDGHGNCPPMPSPFPPASAPLPPIPAASWGWR
jgi:hypothetical protein